MQMNNAKLSVIVPIYGVEQYLDRCIQSIVNVNYKNIEIILVDDGSKDGCPAICDSWKKKDDRIKVIHKPNGGLVSARKAGVGIATGEYATYVDGDDWIEPEMYDCLEQYDVDLIVEGFISDNGEVTKNIKNRIPDGYYEGEKLDGLRKKMIMNEWGDFTLFPNLCFKIFKLEKLRPVQALVPNNISMGEDVAVTYRYMFDANNVVITNNCFYHYVLNPKGMTAGKDVKYLEKCFALFDYMILMEKLLGKQLDNYICSMMINGISILLDPRKKIQTSYQRNMATEYHRRPKVRECVEQSAIFQKDMLIRKMIQTFDEERMLKSKFFVCLYILRCHLKIGNREEHEN